MFSRKIKLSQHFTQQEKQWEHIFSEKFRFRKFRKPLQKLCTLYIFLFRQYAKYSICFWLISYARPISLGIISKVSYSNSGTNVDNICIILSVFSSRPLLAHVIPWSICWETWTYMIKHVPYAGENPYRILVQKGPK